MNRNDFRNPLIQSGIILLCAFFLISVVASSPASGFFSSIFAIIVAIFKTILFLFGLSIALACSIAILVGIYLLTLYFYSGEKAQAIFNQLKAQPANLYDKIKSYKKNASSQALKKVNIPDHQLNDHQEVSAELTPVKTAAFENRMNDLEHKTDKIKESINSATKLLSSLQADVEELRKCSSDPTAILSTLESSAKKVAEQLENQSTALDTVSTKIQEVEQQITADMNSIKKDITDLRKKTTVPEIVSGILSYIDSPEDRDKLTKKVEEVVSRGMTYTQADELFKKSLTAKNYKIVAAHPRLTKDFIRSVKKKFA